MGSLLDYVYGCIMNLKLHDGHPIIVSTVYMTFNAINETLKKVCFSEKNIST